MRIEAADRAGRERLLSYCARLPFALERLRELDCEHLIHESTKPGPGGNAPLLLTTLELCDRRAALVPSQVSAAATSVHWRTVASEQFGGRCRRSATWAGSRPPISTLLCPVREVQQPLGAFSSTPEPDPLLPVMFRRSRRFRTSQCDHTVHHSGEHWPSADPTAEESSIH